MAFDLRSRHPQPPSPFYAVGEGRSCDLARTRMAQSELGFILYQRQVARPHAGRAPNAETGHTPSIAPNAAQTTRRYRASNAKGRHLSTQGPRRRAIRAQALLIQHRNGRLRPSPRVLVPRIVLRLARDQARQQQLMFGTAIRGVRDVEMVHHRPPMPMALERHDDVRHLVGTDGALAEQVRDAAVAVIRPARDGGVGGTGSCR